MSAQARKKWALLAASVAGGMGLALMALGQAWISGPDLEPTMPPRQFAPVGRTLASDLSPERARALLAAMAPLSLPTHGASDDGVKSTLLCFCLHKGPETVRELRRLAAEKFIEGLAAFQDARYEAAIDAFDQAIQRHPREARAFVNRALAHARLGRYAAAAADLTQAISLHETLADAYYGRGLIAMTSGDRDDAKADIRRAAALGDERALRLAQAAKEPVRKG
jgi:tetratricopeptide (TPR) repeat protein